MSQFRDSADRLVTLVGEGLTLTEACKRVGMPYNTVRDWVSAGRRDPQGRYGAFVRALDSGRALCARHEGHDREPGPVEREVERLLAGRVIEGEAAVAAAQARVLAAKVDALATAPGGSAGIALASLSRRVAECVAALNLPAPTDALDELLAHRRARLAARGHQFRPGPNGSGASK
jgi:hypothetical protein